MDSANGISRRPHNGANGGSVWSWLALAAAAGFMAVRSKPRIGVLLGLSIAAMGCWRTRRGMPAMQCGEDARDDSEREVHPPPPPQAAQRGTVSAGTLLLQIEPLPLVIEEHPRATANTGDAGHLLDQEPLLAFEDASFTDTSICNTLGAEIPDAVELPELLDSEAQPPRHPA